ncbi:MAG: biotin-dependent carboxyltransferase family protein [Bacteroidota bacterium]
MKIFKAGIQDTVQDMGRFGYQHLGINPGGVMDKFSAQMANMIAGNEINEAVLELHFPASVFIFQQPALIALCGADFSPSINGEKIPSGHPMLVNKNSILQFHKLIRGARTYMAIHGGLHISRWLGSYSTHLKAKTGGFKGRALLKDDEIAFEKNIAFSSILGEREFVVLPWQADANREERKSGEILVLPGNEWERLTESARDSFTMTSFVITNQSDRMGYRLNNLPLPVMSNDEVISSGVSFGTVQLLPDGKLIILMADHQTTGGYPRVAHVISAHHSRLAQMKSGDKIHFRLTDQQTAEELLIKEQQHLLQLQNACKFRLEEFLHAKH